MYLSGRICMGEVEKERMKNYSEVIVGYDSRHKVYDDAKAILAFCKNV